jgi:hypothetical protein
MILNNKLVKFFLKQTSFILVISLIFQGCQWINPDEEDKSLLYFTSTPVKSVFHNDVYFYKISAKGRTQTLTFQQVIMPAWLEFDYYSQTLSGMATADNLGSHEVKISVSDQYETMYQDFNIKVELNKIGGGSWTTRTPYQWTHDGKPLIGENCIVYSDAAGDESKLFISEKAENSFLELKGLLQIGNNCLFVFPPGTYKLDFYSNRFNLEYQGGFAYYGGAIVISPDSPMYRPNEDWCANQVKHEMMHEIEYLLEARPPSLISDVWFREGLADYYAGNIVITNVAKLNSWMAARITLPGAGNPVKIHTWNDFPSQVQQEKSQGLWYPMFELAVRYVLDIKGYGKSMPDIKKLFLDLRNSSSFSISFEKMTGTTLEDFENNYFSLILPFLQD